MPTLSTNGIKRLLARRNLRHSLRLTFKRINVNNVGGTSVFT